LVLQDNAQHATSNVSRAYTSRALNLLEAIDSPELFTNINSIGINGCIITMGVVHTVVFVKDFSRYCVWGVRLVLGDPFTALNNGASLIYIENGWSLNGNNVSV